MVEQFSRFRFFFFLVSNICMNAFLLMVVCRFGVVNNAMFSFLHVEVIMDSVLYNPVICFCVCQLLEPCVLEVVAVMLFYLYVLLLNVVLLIC